MERPKLRDLKKLIHKEIYPLNEIPKEIITEVASYFIYLIYTGRTDISGGDWGDAFARAIGGKHLASPVGIADVVLDKFAWSMKTVKNSNPLSCKKIRLISGRCSPDYSYGITDPHKDIQKTGRAVLGIWNERINIAQDNYSNVRSLILIRSEDLLSYTLYEEENHRFVTNNYIWEVNKNGNLVGKNKDTGTPCFVWQPHGSQFTILEDVPKSAVKFKIKNPPKIKLEDALLSMGFDESWVEFVD